MFKYNIESKTYFNYFIIIFFLIFLFTGFMIVEDYGMPLDQLEYRQQGIIILTHLGNLFFPELTNEITQNYDVTTIKKYQETFIFSGVPFHAMSSLAEYLFGIEQKKEIYYFKYKFSFLFNFLGILVFYFFLRDRFKNNIISFLGILTVILSPRIFPELFYSPNDIPFLSSLCFFLYFSFKLFKKFNYKNIFFLSFFSGFLAAMRTGGIIFPLIFFLIIVINEYLNKEINKKFIYKFLFLGTSTLLFFLILNPTLWNNIIENTYTSLVTGIKYQIDFPEILYLGDFYKINLLPWHYLPVWLIISIPIINILYFLFGCILFIKDFNLKIKLYDCFIFVSLIIVLFISIFISESLINGWRHLYFIYPLLIYFLVYFLNSIKYKKIIICILSLSLISNIYWIYKYHPYQMVYFNLLGGKNLNDKFELDYWGLSNKDALNKILEHDNREIIKVAGLSRTRLNFSKYLLTSGNYKRILIVDELDRADYVITNYNSYLRRDNFLEEGYKIYSETIVDNIIINSIFLKPE